MTAIPVRVAAPQARRTLRLHLALSLALAALPTQGAASPHGNPATITLHLHPNGTVTKQGYVFLDGLGMRHYHLLRAVSPTTYEKAAKVVAPLGQRAFANADRPMPDCIAGGLFRITATPAIAGFGTLTSPACQSENVATLHLGILDAASISDLADLARHDP